MGIYLNTYENNTVTATDDALIRESLYGPGGVIFYGFDITASQNILTVGSGRGVLCGRSFTHDADEYRITLPTVGVWYGRIYLHLDLSNPDAPLQLLTTTTEELPLPPLEKQSNVNVTYGVYEFEIATFTASSNGITDIEKSYTDEVATPVVLKAYPIGSIYMSVNETNPADLFGGLWERIRGRFLLGESSARTPGTTGGAESVKLTVDQLPAHTHTMAKHTHTAKTSEAGEHHHEFLRNKTAAAGTARYSSTGGTGSEKNITYNAGKHTHTVTVETGGGGNTGSTGGGKAVSVMPPYLVVHMWKRIA